MKTILDTILDDVREEILATKFVRTVADIRAMVADAPPPRNFYGALAAAFGLIAEIKERSPSVGPMREENVREATTVYAQSPIVRAISVLTNQRHFGMDIGRLEAVRNIVAQPVLRKDFLLDEYQVREARAFGADAILLMANVLDSAQLQGFYNLARELGMEALFEVHTIEDIDLLPADARIVGINSRKFQSQSGFVGISGASEKDFSLDMEVFHLASHLPSGCLRVAESGITPPTLSGLRENFQAVLVGTALLRDPRGLRVCLREFEEAVG